MQVSKIITSYGVLKNPSSIVTEMVLINPYNAKFFIEKPFENFYLFPIQKSQIGITSRRCLYKILIDCCIRTVNLRRKNSGFDKFD